MGPILTLGRHTPTHFQGKTSPPPPLALMSFLATCMQSEWQFSAMWQMSAAPCIAVCSVHIKVALSRVYTPWAHMHAHTPTVSAAVYTPVAGCTQRIRRLSPSKFKYVELSRPAQTCANIPANHERAPRSPRADALFCLGTYADVYACVFILLSTQLATCAMQWWRTGRCKHKHLRRLPTHTRAWSINPALLTQTTDVNRVDTWSRDLDQHIIWVLHHWHCNICQL